MHVREGKCIEKFGRGRTEKTLRLEKLKLDNGTVLIYIMRKYDMKG